MTHDVSWNISLATIVIYGVFMPPSAWNLVRHASVGGSPIPAWLFMISFAILQIVGSAMELAGSKYAPIVLQVGLSPIILAMFSGLGEANKLYNLGVPLISDLVVNVGFQVISYAGIAVAAVGIVKVTQGDTSKVDLEQAGISILLLNLAILTVAVLVTLYYYSRKRGSAWLIAAITLSLPLLYIRFIWSCIDIYSDLTSSIHHKFSLPEQGGNVAIYVCLAVLPLMLITLIMIAGGLLSDPDNIINTSDQYPRKESDMSSPQRPDYADDGRRTDYGYGQAS